MLSSLEALEAATVIPSVGFQPKVKPRLPRLKKVNATAEENSPPSAGIAPEEPCLEPVAPSQGTAPSSGHETLMTTESSAPCCSFMPDVRGEGPKRARLSSTPRKRGRRSLEEVVDPSLGDLIRIWLAKDNKMERESAAAKRLERARLDPVPTKETEVVCPRPQVPVNPFAPQVKVVNGEVVLDPNSLRINIGAAADDVSTYRRIDETHTKLNNHSYMKKVGKAVWKREETEAFYKALQQFGSDFEAIQHFFPTRSRRAILLKFKAEEQRDPRRVSQAMLAPRSDVRQYEELAELLKAKQPAVEDGYEFSAWDTNTTE